MKSRIKSMSIGCSAAALFVAAAISTQAMAHSSWLEIQDGKAVLIDGHPDDPSENRGYDAHRFVHGAAYDKSMNAMRVNVSHDGTAKIDLKDKPALVTAHFDNGFWSRSASEGWLRKPGSEVPDAIESMYSHKFSKLYLAPVSQPDKALGDPLEMVPLSDPSSLKPGDTLKVKVTLFGAPLAGAEVTGDMHAGDDAEKTTTDASGIASVKVPKRPLALVEARHSVGLSDDPHVKSVFMSSTIAFKPKQ